MLAASVAFVATAIDVTELARTWRALRSDPGGLGLALAAYAAAFALRAGLWRAVVPELPFGHALAAIHLSLGGNHVLPFRLGEALRVTSVVRRTPVSLGRATASTVALRAADVLAVATLAGLLAPRAARDLVGDGAWVLVLPAAGLWGAGLWWLRRLDRGAPGLSPPTVAAVAVGAAVAWVLESAVMWRAATWAGLGIDFADAVVVTAVTIVAQTVAVAPAGLGTYEAAASAALVALGAPAGPALAAALAAHGVKTAYSLLTGAVSLFVPRPGALGRLRLPPPGGPAAGARPAAGQGGGRRDPVVLFLPAHDEQDAVAGVVARAPAEVDGHPVRVLVVDDGSTDATAARARAAGAEVISLPGNRGLGYAVRVGLAEACRRGAVAVAFCDADGEYDPAELPRLVRPVLEGRADYVVGSRFAGDIRRMLPHRRIGNLLLTRALSFVARRPITDGQTGFRAFSAAAAADAEVIHDFNYAQVLTLDLLAKGYRYLEVPISYSFRTTGRSFVRAWRYLRHVVPAVHAELNAPRRA